MASKALKGALGNMDIDKVDDMMADIQESQDISNEIADAIARPMGFQVIFLRGILGQPVIDRPFHAKIDSWAGRVSSENPLPKNENLKILKKLSRRMLYFRMMSMKTIY